MRKSIVVLLVVIGIIIFFVSVEAQTADSLAIPADTTFSVEPLGPEFAPAPGLEVCGPYFLVTPEGTSFPPAIVMFLDRTKDLRFEYDRRLFLTSVRVIVDAKRRSPRARLHDQAGWVTADLWVPVKGLDNCPCLKSRINAPFSK